MKLIMIAGLTGSGKSTAGKILQKHGYLVFESGNIVRQRFEREGKKDETMQMFIDRLYASEGDDFHSEHIANILYNEAFNAGTSKSAVAVGLRTADQVKNLKGLFLETHTVCIYSSPEERFKRIIQRARSDDPRNFVELLKKDFWELSLGVATVMRDAEQYLINDGDVDTLERRLLELPFI